MTFEQINKGHRAFERQGMFDEALNAWRAINGTCASCHSPDHTVWSCPVEAAKDAAVFASIYDDAALFDLTPKENPHGCE